MSVPAWLRTIVVLLCVGSVAWGGVYHVAPNGNDSNPGSSSGSPWQSLAKANASAVAGDVVIVHGGQYTEGIAPVNNGTSGSPITYQVASGERVVLNASVGVQLEPGHHDVIVDGFEIHATYRVVDLHGASYITVRNCTCYGGRATYQAFDLLDCSYCVIQNNYLDRQDPDADSGGGDGLVAQGHSNHNLIEGNTVTRCEHMGIASCYSGQSFNIWRNNKAYNNHTNFGLYDGVERSVFEGNTGYYQGLVWTGGSGNCLQFTGTHCIIRFNTLYDDTATSHPDRIWWSVVGAGSGSANGLTPSVQYNTIYNNTIYGESDQTQWKKSGWRTDNYSAAMVQNNNNFKNNIFAAAPDAQVEDIDDVRPASSANNHYEGNLLYGSGGAPATIVYYFSGGNDRFTLSQAMSGRSSQWASTNVEGNPLFTNTVGQGAGKDFTLQSGSPAIDAGVHLTVAVAGGIGTLLQVDNAGYFCDGWGVPGVVGDSIRIEAGDPVGIASVDYNSNALTLNAPRSWTQGARIYYYRSDRFRGNAPDIGSHESGQTSTPPPPPSKPLSPALFSPENGAVNVSTNVTLQWSLVPTAQTYHVQLSRDAAFASVETDVNTTNAYLSVSSLDPATTYYWRVNASNGTGTSDWSSVWALATADPGNPSPNILSNPAFDNGTTSWWSYSSGQSEFSVSTPGYEGDHAGKLRIIATGDNTQIYQYNVPLQPNTTYRLSFAAYSTGGHDLDVSLAKHVTPYTAYGLTSAKFDLGTSWKVFTTEFTTANFSQPVYDARLRFWFASYAAAGEEYYIDNIVLKPVPTLLAPTLLAPSTHAVDLPADLTLSWFGSPGATGYAIEVALDNAFTQRVAWDSAVVDTQYHLSSLRDLTTYYWHVSSVYGADQSPFSGVSSFTTGVSSLAAPTIASLPIQDGSVPLEFSLVWSPVPGASRYHLQVALDASFKISVLDDSAVVDTVRRLGPLQDGTSYFVHVRAVNSIARGQFSIPVAFRTSAGQLAMPLLVTLPGQSTNRDVNTSIRWLSVPGAVHYDLQLATDLQFRTVVRNDSSLTDTVAQLGPLAYGTTYFVRVRALSDRAASVFSLPYGFSTVIAAPPPPGGLILANQPQQTSVALSWPSISGAIKYHLQVSLDSLFTSCVVNDSLLTDTLKIIATLNPSTHYFARIRVKGAGGVGLFGSVFSFTTAGIPPSPYAPPDYSLDQNFPNPFNPTTTIRYAVPVSVHVRIVLFNTLGQRVKTLVDADQAAGRYELVLSTGRLASGTYYYVFEAGTYIQTRKLVILK